MKSCRCRFKQNILLSAKYKKEYLLNSTSKFLQYSLIIQNFSITLSLAIIACCLCNYVIVNHKVIKTSKATLNRTNEEITTFVIGHLISTIRDEKESLAYPSQMVWFGFRIFYPYVRRFGIDIKSFSSFLRYQH